MKASVKWCVSTAVGVVAMGVLAQPAMATTWYSAGSPLYAKDGSDTVAAAYGDFYNKGQSHAASKSVRSDRTPGGDGVFVETRYTYFVGGAWTGSSGDRTGVWRDSAWRSATYTDPLRSDGSRARGQIHVCEDESWSGDPCSSWTFPTFNY